MEQEKTLKAASLIFLVDGPAVFLAPKKRNIGAGYLNGYGGGIEDIDTDMEDCAVRELTDESSVVADKADLQKVAVVYFHNTKSDGTTFVVKVYVYILARWKGVPTESEEMGKAHPYLMTTLPLDEMMPADREWVRRVLAGELIIATAHYGPFQKELLGPVVVRVVTREELEKE